MGGCYPSRRGSGSGREGGWLPMQLRGALCRPLLVAGPLQVCLELSGFLHLTACKPAKGKSRPASARCAPLASAPPTLLFAGQMVALTVTGREATTTRMSPAAACSMSRARRRRMHRCCATADTQGRLDCPNHKSGGWRAHIVVLEEWCQVAQVAAGGPPLLGIVSHLPQGQQ